MLNVGTKIYLYIPVDFGADEAVVAKRPGKLGMSEAWNSWVSEMELRFGVEYITTERKD